MEHNFFTLCFNFFIKNDYIRRVENRNLERGDESPLFFYKKMIQKKRIIELAQERIDELDNILKFKYNIQSEYADLILVFKRVSL